MRRRRPWWRPSSAWAQAATTPLHILLKGTNFQIKVWEALLRIPSGSVSTYEDIARRIGQPRAMQSRGQRRGSKSDTGTHPLSSSHPQAG